MIHRKADKWIDNHFRTTGKALLLTGARQVGKTYAVRRAAERLGWHLVEMNFLLQRDAEIIPLEVKSGKDYDRHVALNNVMKNPEYGIKRAVVLCNDNVKVRGAVVYMPIYMLMFMEKVKDEGPKIYKLDLEGLT